jgi:hypothetical protein
VNKSLPNRMPIAPRLIHRHTSTSFFVKRNADADGRAVCGADGRAICSAEQVPDGRAVEQAHCGAEQVAYGGTVKQAVCEADGRPVCGADGRPVCGADGRPVCGADGRAVCGADRRAVCGADGHPVCGADGRPVCGTDHTHVTAQHCSSRRQADDPHGQYPDPVAAFCRALPSKKLRVKSKSMCRFDKVVERAAKTKELDSDVLQFEDNVLDSRSNTCFGCAPRTLRCTTQCGRRGSGRRRGRRPSFTLSW